MEGDVWQVNAGHEDYLAFDDGRARLRSCAVDFTVSNSDRVFSAASSRM